MVARILILLLTLSLFQPGPQGRLSADEPAPPERTFLPLANTTTPRVAGCKLLAQSPADETFMKPGADFSVNWILLNTGNIPWHIDTTAVRFVLGDAMHFGGSTFDLPYNVNPGASLDFKITMRAPSDGGIYTTNWAIVQDGAILCRFYAHIHVPKTPW
jgi:Ig-like domain from next to BRCA1 gene